MLLHFASVFIFLKCLFFQRVRGNNAKDNILWVITPKIKAKWLGIVKFHSGIRIATLPKATVWLFCNAVTLVIGNGWREDSRKRIKSNWSYSLWNFISNTTFIYILKIISNLNKSYMYSTTKPLIFKYLGLPLKRCPVFPVLWYFLQHSNKSTRFSILAYIHDAFHVIHNS